MDTATMFRTPTGGLQIEDISGTKSMIKKHLTIQTRFIQP